jgi:hypothetical protein
MSMSDALNSNPVNADARRCALEAIAKLAHIKKIAADQILRPAGVPEPLILTFVKGKDAATGAALTKRQGGAAILDQLARDGQDTAVVRKIVQIASTWDAFHLSENEYEARAVVQKAREVEGVLAETETREREEHERQVRGRAERSRKERDATIKKESALLVAMFDEAAKEETEPHQRGYFLQDLLNRAFLLHGISVVKSFTRNNGGEQIDAAFALDGWHYLVECRWRAKLADIRELDGLYGQISRSGKQTMGLFLSVNGWSENVVPLIKQNPNKSLVLMEGYDLRTVLSQPLDLRHLLQAKVSALNLDSEPYFSVTQFMKS